MSPVKLKTPENTLSYMSPPKQFEPTTEDNRKASVIFMESVDKLRKAKHIALITKQKLQPQKIFAQPKDYQRQEKNVDGTIFTKHREYIRAIKNNEFLKFHEIFTQAHATPEGGSYFYNPSYNSNELLILAIQTEIQTNDSRRPYVDALLQNHFVKSYLNTNKDHLIQVVLLLYVRNDASRALKSKISSNIYSNNHDYFAFFLGFDVQIYRRRVIEKINRTEYSIIKTLMEEETQRRYILKNQKIELSLFIEEMGARSLINKSSQSKTFMLYLLIEEGLKRLIILTEQMKNQEALKIIKNLASSIKSPVSNTPSVRDCESIQGFSAQNSELPQEFIMTDCDLMSEEGNLSLTPLSIKAYPEQAHQDNVQNENIDQPQQEQTHLQSFLKDTLLRKIDDYIHWRNNKNSHDNRNYSMGFFTRMRHFSAFGEIRAQNLKNQLSGLTNDDAIFAQLKTHFNQDSRLNNHSLDTYLLEGLEQYHAKLDITPKQDDNGLRNIIKRETFRLKFC